MKRLILVRHAKTEQPTGHMTDFERKLLPRGHKDSILIAEQLHQKNIIPDLILSSPAKRAKQTSELFAKTFNYDSHKIKFNEFIYDGYTTGEMVSELQKTDNNYSSLMLIGHNPDIASLAMNLTNHNLYQFPTCAVISIIFDINSWSELEVRNGQTELFIYPSQFKD